MDSNCVLKLIEKQITTNGVCELLAFLSDQAKANKSQTYTVLLSAGIEWMDSGTAVHLGAQSIVSLIVHVLTYRLDNGKYDQCKRLQKKFSHCRIALVLFFFVCLSLFFLFDTVAVL